MNQEPKKMVTLNHMAGKIFDLAFMYTNSDIIAAQESEQNPIEATFNLIDSVAHTKIYGRNKNESLNLIFDLLRICIVKKSSDLYHDNNAFSQIFFHKLSIILNGEVSLFPMYNDDTTRFNLFMQPGLSEDGNQIIPRPILEWVIEYINELQETSEALRPQAPIGVCPLCDGIFMKKRTDHVYCSKYCKSASWANEKGKEYFAEKARNNRAIKNRRSTTTRSAKNK